ncbi:BA75_02505T0 [Komagataella pastoris]|uniref:BA75_02505T0 n=1 Tax=Komagataella pastoris TaxID=4922 RepID=A0A1B2JDP2_PICPA|nr:BA75_02505T0 [Komagataella pastoris]
MFFCRSTLGCDAHLVTCTSCMLTQEVVKSITKQKLTNSQLLSVCRNCGLPTGALNKAQLIENISMCLAKEPLFTKDRKYSIVSIDVGVKNFAFTRFQLQGGDVFKSRSSLPSILEWFKLDLEQFEGMKIFSPLAYSKMAYYLVENLIFKISDAELFTPSVLLIERQRFRSNGGSSVLESVIKSNIIENMIISNVYTMGQMNNKYKTKIVSSSPASMVNFWTNYKMSDGSTYLSMNSKNSKNSRITLVDRWFDALLKGAPASFILGDQLASRITNKELALLARCKNPSRRIYLLMEMLNKPSIGSSVVKGDDLADSLLHGLSLLRFEQNKVKLRENLEDLQTTISEIEQSHVQEISIIHQ